MVIKKNKKENFYHLADDQISNISCIMSRNRRNFLMESIKVNKNNNDEIFLPPNRQP